MSSLARTPARTGQARTGQARTGQAHTEQARHRLAPGTPIVLRDAGRAQVGLSAPDAVVLTGPAEALATFLALLDGRHTLSSAAGRSGLDADAARRTVQSLATAGLLADLRPAPTPRIRIVGLGLLGSLLSRHLHDHGASLWLADEEPADPDVHPRARAGASNADAAAAALDAGDRSRRSARPPAGASPSTWVVGHWAKPDDLLPDLTVVATDRPECDRIVPDGLMRDDQPHLLLRSLGDGAVVGPLVHPGHGPCLRCCDLTRRDLDAEWPTVLSQLCRVPGHPPPAAAAWAAATAAAQVLAWVRGGRPETLGATLELRTHDWTTRLRRWPAHPACGCGWR